MNIIVTGGSGFIGTNLVQFLLDEPDVNVVNIDIKRPRNNAHYSSWTSCDICDYESLEKIFFEFTPSIVVHLAARTDLTGRTLEDYSANTDGVANIIKCCNSVPDVKRVIFASSMLVCRLGYIPGGGNDYCPTTVYGESKVLGEKLVKSSIFNGLEWIIVRPTSLWGPWFDKPYKNFFDVVRAGYFMFPNGYKIQRSYGFIGNSIDQLSCLMRTENNNALYSVFYLADYIPIEISDWAKQIISVSKKGRIFRPYWLVLKILALVGDLLKYLGFKNIPMTSFRLNNMLTSAVYDTTDLRMICGDQRYSSQQGVEKTIKWIER
jgi:nucleoside-diphosphate-sugar epimerase